jgi:hypothetical protein
MTYLSNGKGENSIITKRETMVNSVRTVQSTQFSSFSVLTVIIRLEHKQDKRRAISQLSNGYLNSLINGLRAMNFFNINQAAVSDDLTGQYTRRLRMELGLQGLSLT